MQMSGYTKLFQSILASTIWRADDKTRIVWITLLAMCDKHGVAEGSVPGLADFARVSVEDCAQALLVLMQPDPWSRTKAHEGRRIEDCDGGWRILNHGKHRDKMSADERREYNRLAQAEHRASKRVSTPNDMSALSAHTDTDTYTEARSDTETRAYAPEADKCCKKPYRGDVTRPQPIQARRRKDAAFEGPRVYVPQRLHADFVALRDGDADLWPWYARVSDEWSIGSRKQDEPGAEMFAFWRARYAEQWPVLTPVKLDSRTPKWLRDALAARTA